MIECNVYLNKPRELDGKKVYARFSNAFVELETNHVFAAVPEDRAASEFASTLSGRVRNNQTGKIYECAHDVEDSPCTYTEVFPNPRQLSEIQKLNYGGGGYLYTFNCNPYPTWDGTKTYMKGDRVISYASGKGKPRVYESEIDNNKGVACNIYGWDMLIPYIPEFPEPDYVTIEEFNAIIDEIAAEKAEAEAETDGGESA